MLILFVYFSIFACFLQIRMKRAIFPGSFDPFTIGHYSIVQRGLAIFDEIVVGIGNNQAKKTLFSAEKRLEIIQDAFYPGLVTKGILERMRICKKHAKIRK